MSEVLSARIRDRLSPEWLTPSELVVWKEILRFDGPPHRVVNVYGGDGSGKTFLGWLMERQKHATYCAWSDPPRPVLPRLVLDDAPSDRAAARQLRPLVDKLGLQQIILLTRARVDEPAMPAFELRVTADDLAHFRATLYRYLKLTLPDGDYLNYRAALDMLA